MMEDVVVTLCEGADQDGFRTAVRSLIAGSVSPDRVTWQAASSPTLFDAPALPEASPPVTLPREVAELVRIIVCHREPQRYALLYALIWRLHTGERALLEMHSDPLVHRLSMMAKSVRRDLHRMQAFVRFRRVSGIPEERYVAWFEPEHFIIEEIAPFFVDRFCGLNWSILTPIGSLHWNGHGLRHGAPGRRDDVPASDAIEAGWSTYYASTFNPARLNRAAMQREMPRKYWRNLPETKSIPDLIRNASSRVDALMDNPPVPARKKDPIRAVAARNDNDPKTLAQLNAIISASEPFVKGGTVAVLGEGPLHPALAFVGEQPGDQEDLQGHPFVGPAGKMLDAAMGEAGIDRSKSYLTNAVKHFKYEQRGKRRLHQKPTMGEVRHYRWWLEKELQLVQPKLVVALGATAVLALAGKALPIARFRGPTEFDGHAGFITVHPSYLLRVPDAAEKRKAYAAFVADLKKARTLAASLRAA